MKGLEQPTVGSMIIMTENLFYASLKHPEDAWCFKQAEIAIQSLRLGTPIPLLHFKKEK